MSFGKNSFTDALNSYATSAATVGTKKNKNTQLPIGGNIIDTLSQAPKTNSIFTNDLTDRGRDGNYGFGTSGNTGTKSANQPTNTTGSGTGSGSGSGSSNTVAPRDPNTTDAGSDGQYDTGQGGDTTSGTPFSLGGTTYSALGLQTLLNNPYSLAQAFLNDLGSNYNTPTMMGAMGQFPALAGTLDLMLTGDQRMTGDMVDDGATAQRLVDLMRGQLTPGGGIDAYSLINKMLNLASTEVTSPGSGSEDQVKSALGALLSGVNSSGAAVGSQVNTVNDLIKVALVNSNPAMAASIAAMLDYYGNSYITQAAKISDTNPIPSYAQWLREQGLIFR